MKRVWAWVKSKDAANLATVFALPIAALSILAVVCMTISQNNLEEDLSATESYGDYLQLWFDHPGLNCYSEANEGNERYVAFVAIMATALEEIVLTQEGDREWLNTIKFQIRRHLPYLENEMNAGHYSSKFADIVHEVSAEEFDRDEPWCPEV